MENEHEKFKNICDEIKYDIQGNNFSYSEEFGFTSLFDFQTINLREIIFTTEFMEKLVIYINSVKWFTDLRDWLFVSLDDPTQYLYNLIFPKK